MPAWLPLLALCVVVAACYSPGLTGGFAFDDFPNIVTNAALHVSWHSNGSQWLAAVFSSPSSELQRPLAMLSFAVNHALSGLDPYWMKLTNVGIHVLNTALVYGLARSLLQVTGPDAGEPLRPRWIALWISAAWALNPINLMAVLFVVQRMESLSHTFVLAGLWMYLHGRNRLRQGRSGWGLVLCGLIGGTVVGTLAKESAVLLPLYAVLLEWALLRFRDGRRLDRRLLVTFALCLLLPGVIAIAWKVPALLSMGAWTWRDFGPVQRLLTEARVLVDYLHWTLVPSLDQMSLYHDDYVVSRGLMSPPTTLLSIIGLAVLAVAAIWLRRRRPLVALGIAWFFAAHLLTATIVPLELVYEHRNYFASLGLVVALADVLLRLPSSAASRRLGGGVAIVLVLLYAGATTLRASEWSSPLRFSSSEAAKHPLSSRATYGLARNLVILTGFDARSPYVPPAFAALDRAMATPGSSPLPEQAAILLASRLGMPIADAWWRQLDDKLRTLPPGPQQSGALAELVDCTIKRLCHLPVARLDAAFNALLQRPPSAEVLSVYANYLLNIRNEPTQALHLWQQAVRQAPDVVQYQETLARMEIAVGDLDAAAATIRHLRAQGRWGQNESAASRLEQQLVRKRSDAPHDGTVAPQ